MRFKIISYHLYVSLTFISLFYLITMIVKNRADIEYAREGKRKKERSAIVERGFRGWLYAGRL